MRPETSPDDVAGMERAVGILTATGGFASHAAVVARGWGKPAVVGASEVRVGTDGISVDGRSLAGGDVLSIDGATGEVFEGVASGVATVVPEAKVLLGWARELGIRIGEGGRGAGADRAGRPRRPMASPQPTTRCGRCSSRATRSPTSWGMRSAWHPGEAQALLDALVADGTAEAGAGAFRLTAVGREQATALIAEDREAWGADAATGALDAFLDLDQRMKAIVTDWQTRGPRDAQRPHGRGLRRLGPRSPRGPPSRRRGVAGAARGRAPAPGALRRAARARPLRPRRPATGSTSRRRASTATTAPGSSSTRT